MKRILDSTFGLVIMLFLGLAMAACSTEKEEAEVINNPNYNPETGEVNTQFVFTVSTGNESTTRQSGPDVQSNVTSSEDFRGVERTNILAFSQSKDGLHLYTDTLKALKLYDLATVLSAGAISDTMSKRVIELSLPLHTNTMLFYGKAIKNKESRAQGEIDFNVSSDPKETSFRLRSRLLDADTTKFRLCEELLEDVLSRVVSCGLHKEAEGKQRDFRYAFKWDASAVKGTDIKDSIVRASALNKIPSGQTQHHYTDTDGLEVYVGSLDWKDLGARYNQNMTPLEEILSSTFHAFTNIDENEVRAGSSLAVLHAISNLWLTNNKVADATPTSPEEHIAKLLAQRLDTRFKNYFDSTSVGSNFLPIDTIAKHLADYTGQNSNKYMTLTNDVLLGFPTSMNLPMGAAQLNYSSGKFSYSGYDQGITLGIDNEKTDLTRIMWPAELCYFGNSPIRVSSESKESGAYPSKVSDWQDMANQKWNDFTKNSHVQSNTRSVAMQNDINYGTALLESKVIISDGTLYDNNHALHPTESNNEIKTEGVPGLFTLTGILIGGQTNEVGWNYIQKNIGASFNYVVYDNAVGYNASTKAYEGIKVPAYKQISESNYTLLFDNYTMASTGQSDVYVALEFVNNTGEGFYGKQGLIRNDGTFYIVGKLELSGATPPTNFEPLVPSISTGSDGQPTKSVHPLPPYNDDGTTKDENRIFIQDYVTTATFLLNQTSLQNAFVTVPDLRSTNISLGMSVNLQWRKGLEYNVILGNN